ncbi:protein polyglycylase TTLL10 [Thalassophryne amazonica]|uniref:protein polyglycylase TTLL10 n=1 Tax=Thalassophryne amazonica TaxID=390379 RepID=UPI001471B215|nr:protein polyglycylase TTLL10 [Thalassophryne amazonica]
MPIYIPVNNSNLCVTTPPGLILDFFQVERCHHRPVPGGPTIYSYVNRQREWQAKEPQKPGPFYFFGGFNGAEIVSNYCESRGWRRIYDKHREDFKLKWCETRSPSNYHNFRPGEKAGVSDLPNNTVLTHKGGPAQQPAGVRARVQQNEPRRRAEVTPYIQRPLLLKGRKSDVRAYLLIACTAPYMVFFRHGYVRLTCDLYDPSTNNLSTHLTNQYVQKKNPLYSQLKEDTVWSMEAFNTYVNHECAGPQGVPRDWVLAAFTRRMQQIMTQCFLSVKSKLDCRLGFFDLIGCDFMFDADFQVWLLEMNCNPALHTNCEVLKKVIPATVVEILDLTLETFTKCRLGQRILPLASQRDFVLLYTEPVLPRSKSYALTNRQFNHKPTKKLQKATQNENGERGSGSMAGSCPTTYTSPLQQSSARNKDQSVPPPDDTQTMRDQKLQPQGQKKLKTLQAVTCVCDAHKSKEETSEDKIREHSDVSTSERKEQL